MNRRSRIALRLLLLAVVCLIPVYCWNSLNPRVGKNVSIDHAPISGLPASAKNISYNLPGSFGSVMLYEFDSTESEFQNWAKANGWTPTPIGEESAIIKRYGHDSYDSAAPEETTIRHGYFYSWVDPQASDNRLSLGYDSDIGRVYYYRSYR